MAMSESGDEHAPPVMSQPREGDGEHGRSAGEREHSSGEHDAEHRQRDEHGSRAGEESNVYIGRMDTWDATRNGLRLILGLDEEEHAFIGTVENTTEQTICAVRVEVHLSSGVELGPTNRIDLQPDATTRIELAAVGARFERWTAHPEMSACPSG